MSPYGHELPDRGKILFILILVLQSYSSNATLPDFDNIVETDNGNSSHQITAVSCSSEKVKIKANRCSQLEIINGYESNYHLLQVISNPTIPAIRCIVRQSISSWYCGRYSHLHLASPAIVEQPMLISTADCNRMVTSKLFIAEGIAIPVFYHKMNSQHVIINGSITYDNGLLYGTDPGCIGYGLYFENQLIPSSFQDKQIKVKLEKIMITQYEEGCFHNNNLIGHNCITDTNLRTEEDRIYVPKGENAQKHYLNNYRTLEINKASLYKHELGQGRQTKILYSPQKSFALELKFKHKFETILEYYDTNLKSVKVWLTNSMKPYFPFPHENEKNYNIQLEIAFSFLKYQDLFVKKLNCLKEESDISNNVQYHRFEMTRQLGEIQLLTPCKPMLINVTQGEKLPCYLNHLTVRVNNTLYGISPFARILKNISSLIPVQCHEAPVFLRLSDGKFVGDMGRGFELIQVEDENITMEHIHQIYFDRKNNIDKSDLITEEEITLSNLALDATEFHMTVQSTWFRNLYDKTINWLSQQWQSVLLIIGVIMTSIGAVVCLSYSYYMLKCTKLYFRNEHNTDDEHNNILLRDMNRNDGHPDILQRRHSYSVK